jgi:hypothetical protein
MERPVDETDHSIEKRGRTFLGQVHSEFHFFFNQGTSPCASAIGMCCTIGFSHIPEDY